MGTEVAEQKVGEFAGEVLDHVPRQPFSVAGVLVPIISGTQACKYEAAEYFVAWQGVVTIVYTGIPSSIVEFKRELEHNLKGVRTENPGSMWPKTTIGCLQDDKTLTLEQLKTLRNICSEESPALATTESITVDNLSIAIYENRRLEKIITEVTVPLTLPVNKSKPLESEKAYVRSVLTEFADSNLDNYHQMTSLPGHRSAHYLQPVVEATVVHHLQKVPASLNRFRDRVDAELPGMYDWFADSSLHITIRALT
ncbi:hypothetical protein R1sor_019457 [Riccia sorocarpa]|uniref:Uncharacterized protein n=1 Tax=Riccia sorocarpa TaxID=122646 RepID=A0ABD3IGD0_9MARC